MLLMIRTSSAGECLCSTDEYLDILTTAAVNDTSSMNNKALEALHCLYNWAFYLTMGYEYFAAPKALDKVEKMTQPYRGKVYQFVPKFLESEVQSIREHAACALAYYKWPDSYEYLVKCKQASISTKCVLLAILGDKRAIPIIIDYYRNGDQTYKELSYMAKMNCLNALYHLASPEILSFIDSVIETPKPPQILKRAEKVKERILELYADVPIGKFDVHFNGNLYKRIIYGHEYFEVDTIGLPTILKKKITKYLNRYSNFKSRIETPKALDFPTDAIYQKKYSIERTIVSLIDYESIEDIAAEFIGNAVICYEWEGFSDGPLAEAKYVEEYLEKNFHSPMKPFLYLFLAHRYRCAYECLRSERDIERRKQIEYKYKYYMHLAKNYPDLLIPLIAEDMENQEFLYLDPKR